MSCELTTEQKIQVLRSNVHCIGWTPGKPFESATLTMGTGRDFDIYSIKEILEMLDELAMAIMLQSELSVCQRAVKLQLQACGFLDAFAHLQHIQETYDSWPPKEQE